MENNVWTIIIPSVVTVIGFFINYKLLRKEKNLDLSKYKNEEQIKKLIDVPEKILFYIDNYMKLVAKLKIDEVEFEKTFKSIFNSVLCYGSEDAVKLLLYFEHMIYQGIDDGVNVSSSQFIAPLVLLLIQLKYDITSAKTSPKAWYVRFRSQKLLETEFYENSVKEINDIVDLLGLQCFLKINDEELY